MTETISAMRFIKMCALEDVFQRLLHTLRQYGPASVPAKVQLLTTSHLSVAASLIKLSKRL